jgi:parvulin-like peptidyl-prolyl isomerase
LSRRARDLPAHAFPWNEVDPERRNAVLLIGGIIAVVAIAFALIAYGYYTERIKPDTETVLTVGKHNYSYDYLEKRARSQVNQGLLSTSKDQFGDGLISLMTTMENEELTRQAAKSIGVTATDQEIDDRMIQKLHLAADVDRATYAARLHGELVTTGFSLAEYRDMAKADVLARKIRDKFQADIPAEADHANLVVIHLDTQANALKARDRLKNGDLFGVVAAEMSIDDSKSDGGDIGWTPRGAFDDKVEEAIYGHSGVTDIIESDSGYYIFNIRGQEVRPVTDDDKNLIVKHRYDTLISQTRERIGGQAKLRTDQVQRLTQALVPGG